MKISVITVVRNAAGTALKSVTSIHDQVTTHQIEHVVVDGQSTDGTWESILPHARSCDRYVSEPDHGIYDAMNKGMGLATGHWIIFMNAGDYFHDSNVVERAAQWMETVEADVWFGETLTTYTDKYGERVFHHVPSSSDGWNPSMPACHQSIFYRAEMLRQYPFDQQYSWCADYDQYCRMRSGGLTFKTLPFVVSVYDGNGADGRAILSYIRERFVASRLVASGAQRWRTYGGELVHAVLWGSMVNILKGVLPTGVICYLRRFRGTQGITEVGDEPHAASIEE